MLHQSANKAGCEKTLRKFIETYVERCFCSQLSLCSERDVQHDNTTSHELRAVGWRADVPVATG